MMLETACAITAWVDEARKDSHLTLRRVAVDACDQWHFKGERMAHETGAFFSLTGVSVPDEGEALHGRHLPMIDQPEMGWLGFLARPRDGQIDWLLQAKTEPGNVGGTQVAPSIQATRSNYRRLHGGAATAFLKLFREGSTFASDAPNSEQGTSFLWKFNRNSVLVFAGEAAPDVSQMGHWRWSTTEALRELLGHDYVVNTDARSVVSTAPWGLMSGGRPLFEAPCLQRSYSAAVNSATMADVRRKLRRAMLEKVLWTLKPMEELPGWDLRESGLFDPAGDERVACYAVRVDGREVDHWSQPFLTQAGTGDHVLLMRIGAEGAQFFLRSYREVGFGQRSEFGPSLHSSFALPAPMEGWAAPDAVTAGRQLAAIKQSDEGGRFMLADASYRIVLLDRTPEKDSYLFGHWVSLSVLEQLVRQAGTTTNELRTLASVVLSKAFDEACQGLR